MKIPFVSGKSCFQVTGMDHPAHRICVHRQKCVKQMDCVSICRKVLAFVYHHPCTRSVFLWYLCSWLTCSGADDEVAVFAFAGHLTVTMWSSWLVWCPRDSLLWSSWNWWPTVISKTTSACTALMKRWVLHFLLTAVLCDTREHMHSCMHAPTHDRTGMHTFVHACENAHVHRQADTCTDTYTHTHHSCMYLWT